VINYYNAWRNYCAYGGAKSQPPLVLPQNYTVENSAYFQNDEWHTVTKIVKTDNAVEYYVVTKSNIKTNTTSSVYFQNAGVAENVKDVLHRIWGRPFVLRIANGTNAGSTNGEIRYGSRVSINIFTYK